MALNGLTYWRHVGVTSNAGGNIERHYFDLAEIDNLTNGAVAVDQILYASPFWTGNRGGQIDRLTAWMTATASCKVRVGIYDNANVTSVYPSTLLFSTPELDTTTIGVVANSISMTFSANTYLWFAFVCSHGAVTPKFFGCDDNQFVPGTSLRASTSGLGTYMVSHSFSALPATFPAFSVATVGGLNGGNAMPILGVRYSG